MTTIEGGTIMTVDRVISRTSVAASAALALGLSVSAVAQFGGRPAPPYTPEPGARDLKSVLFNWPWHMGMLRGIEEHELIVTLEYRGEGTIQVNGQPCTIAPFQEGEREGELGKSGYRISSAYQFAGSRTQIECTLPNGETYSNIEVVSGEYAWDEDIPGAGLVPGRGTATPKPETREERLIRLWASPQGAPKAALAGAGIDPLKVFRNPGGLLEAGTSKIGETSVTWDGDTPVVTFPIPGVEGATAVARLDDRFMTESVVVTHGDDTYEFTYGDYDDYNNPLNKIEVYMAGRMTERKNGVVMRDIRTVQTETGSVYVVVPVPPGVGPTEPIPMFGSDQEPPVLDSDAPTPRLANGKPDLTGSWRGPSKFFIWRYGNRRCAPTQLEGCSPQWNQTIDFEFEAASRFGPDRPIYRPEHWDEVIYRDMWTNREDPIMTCQPMGIPRQGPPGRIFQTEDDITLLYGRGGDGGGGYPDFRVIATDGRELDERQLLQTKYTGHSLGHWEGDTLVIESVGFTPTTWLARGGFFHSDDMKVIERFTRKGDQLLYEVIIEDPEVLLQPWRQKPMLLTFAGETGGLVGVERGHCENYEEGDIVTQLRH
ncbi:MAG TPA: hypothetical protein VF339_03065 [Gammaproteobacteria bacterium]